MKIDNSNKNGNFVGKQIQANGREITCQHDTEGWYPESMQSTVIHHQWTSVQSQLHGARVGDCKETRGGDKWGTNISFKSNCRLLIIEHLMSKIQFIIPKKIMLKNNGLQLPF